MDTFDIPIVLIIFKRIDTTLQILERISQIRPKKLYILGDQGRNEKERELVALCRKTINETINNWDCEVIKNYAETNRGIYANIGLGAKWVFQKEKWAIFLEDDNLPEITFFYYCKELLERYFYNEQILWICGTNYLGQYNPKSRDSYMFTKHLLPCGWASWSYKFLNYYDGELLLAENKTLMKTIKKEYEIKALYKQQMCNIENELNRKNRNIPFISWDFQMALTIRAHKLYGISPCNNQINNIGADIFSEHGGTNTKKIMTKRFCGVKSLPLTLPLNHPKSVKIDKEYEDKIGKVILEPLNIRFYRALAKIIKYIFHIDQNKSFTIIIKKVLKGIKVG